MSAAYSTADGDLVQLDGKTDGPIVVTPSDVQDPEKLARMLQDALRGVAEQKRLFAPRQRKLYVRDRAVTNGGVLVIEHGFGGRVNFRVERWVPQSVAGTPFAIEVIDSQTDENTITLYSGADGTITICVSEAG